MPEDSSVYKRGNVGEHSEFLAFATIIACGYLDLTDPSGEIARGRLDVAEVSREARGQRAKGTKGSQGELVRRAYYLQGEEVWIRSDVDGVSRRLCQKDEVAALADKMRADLIDWTEAAPDKSTENDVTEGDHGISRGLASANELLRLLDADGLKSPASSKSDLYLTFKQPNGTLVTQGFSVKSLMGSDSCLINHSGATLITYEILNSTPLQVLDVESEYVREVIEPARVTKRKAGKSAKIGPATIIPAMAKGGLEVKFSSIPHEVFLENLMSIDTRFPEMLAHVLYQRFLTEKSTPAEIVALPASVEMMSRIGFSRESAAKVLEDKIKSLFKKYAQGMNSAESWDGSTEVKGGWVLVIKDGRVTGYCFEDDDSFRSYLFESTYFDTPDVKRVPMGKKRIGAYVGRPYLVEGRTFMDLSLIVKFRKRRVADHERPNRTT